MLWICQHVKYFCPKMTFFIFVFIFIKILGHLSHGYIDIVICWLCDVVVKTMTEKMNDLSFLLDLQNDSVVVLGLGLFYSSSLCHYFSVSLYISLSTHTMYIYTHIYITWNIHIYTYIHISWDLVYIYNLYITFNACTMTVQFK